MDMTTKQGKATPDQQSMYDVIMVQVRNMIYNDQGMKTVLEQIKSAEAGPQRGIGYTAAMLMKSVKGGIEKQGKTVPPDILMAAYAETVADLTEVAVAANIVPEDQKAAIAKAAMADGAKIFQQASKKKPAQPAQPMPPPAQPGLIKQAAGA